MVWHVQALVFFENMQRSEEVPVTRADTRTTATPDSPSGLMYVECMRLAGVCESLWLGNFQLKKGAELLRACNEELEAVNEDQVRRLRLFACTCHGNECRIQQLKEELEKTVQENQEFFDSFVFQTDCIMSVLQTIVTKTRSVVNTGTVVDCVVTPPSEQTDDMLKELEQLRFFHWYESALGKEHESLAVPLFEEMDKNMSQLNTSITQLGVKLGMSEARAKNLETEKARANKKLGTMKQESKKLDDLMNQLAARCESLQEECASLQKRCESLEEKYEPSSPTVTPFTQAMEKVDRELWNGFYFMMTGAMIQIGADCFNRINFKNVFMACVHLEIEPFDPELLKKAKAGTVEANDTCFEPNVTVSQLIKKLSGTSLDCKINPNGFRDALLRRILFVNHEACHAIKKELKSQGLTLSNVPAT